jgi:hypothetical protein
MVYVLVISMSVIRAITPHNHMKELNIVNFKVNIVAHNA